MAPASRPVEMTRSEGGRQPVWLKLPSLTQAPPVPESLLSLGCRWDTRRWGRKRSLPWLSSRSRVLLVLRSQLPLLCGEGQRRPRAAPRASTGRRGSPREDGWPNGWCKNALLFPHPGGRGSCSWLFGRHTGCVAVCHPHFGAGEHRGLTNQPGGMALDSGYAGPGEATLGYVVTEVPADASLVASKMDSSYGNAFWALK
jgi:hypothetical protein